MSQPPTDNQANTPGAPVNTNPPTDNVIRPPWTAEQVAALNMFQRRGGMHPFTCGGEHTTGSPMLVAREDGWHCPDPYHEGCDYTQDWAHAWMVTRGMAVFEATAPSSPSDQTLRDRIVEATAAVFVEAVDTAVRLGWALARRSWGQRAAVGGLRGVPGLPVPAERSRSL